MDDYFARQDKGCKPMDLDTSHNNDHNEDGDPMVIDLKEKLTDDKTQYSRMKFNHVVSQVENPMRIRQMRRDIARINTELTRRKKQTGK